MNPPTTDDAAPLQLSAVELDACWEMLRLGDTPLTLTLPSPGRSHAERAELITKVRAELGRRALADQHGPSDTLTEHLRLLANPDHQLDLRLHDNPDNHNNNKPHRPGGPGKRDTPGKPGNPYREVTGIGAVSGQRGLVVFRRGELITLRPVRATQVIPVLLAAIGPVQPGPGRTVNIPAEVYDNAQRATTDGTLWSMADELVGRGLRRVDAEGWARMCTGVRGFGQLGSAFRPEGVPRLGPWVIGFHRTGTGHFLQLRRPGRDGFGGTVTVCPLDPVHLRRLVDELLAERC